MSKRSILILSATILALFFAFVSFSGLLEEMASPSIAEAQTPPDVTLNDTVYWDAVIGSTKYEVRVLSATGGPFWPDAANSSIVHDNGTVTSFALSQALTGAPLAQYKPQIRAQSPATAWSQITVNYVGLSPPQNLRLTP